MPYLQEEQKRAQAEIQVADAAVTNLTTQISTQRQALTSAQAQVEASRNALTTLQGQRPALDAAVVEADQAVATLERRIAEHEANEPPEFIGGVERTVRPMARLPITGAPRPNPAWKKWKQQLDALAQQRSQAQATANAARTRLSELDGRISQAQAALQAAETQVTQAGTVLEQLSQTLGALRDRAAVGRQRLSELVSQSGEIDRNPMDRNALEQAAAKLSVRTLELEDALAAARAVSAQADATLSAMLGRRKQLEDNLTEVSQKILDAEIAVRGKDAVAADRFRELNDHIAGGP